jgi:GxxExxY protein
MTTSAPDAETRRDYDLAGRIIGAAMKIHRTLGPGFLEEVYCRALALELVGLKISFQEEHALPVYYENVVVGNYRADFYIETELIIEIKAVQSLVVAHEIQLVNYLTAARVDSGLLLNFGSDELEFKRKYRRRKQA